MAALKCNPAHRYSVVIFTFSGLLGLQGSIFCLVTEALNPGLGGVRDAESSLGAHWSFYWFCHVAAHVSKGLKHVLSPLLGRGDLVYVLLVHLFVCFVRVSFCHFLFLLVSGAGCGL